MMKIHAYGETDIGKVRKENQDSYLMDHEFGLYIVADGMGGMQNGTLASKYVVHGLASLLKQQDGGFDNKEPQGMAKFVQKTINDINLSLCQVIGGNSGSTLVFGLFWQDSALIANVGDSPGYLYREGVLKQVTKDHNVAGTLLDRGGITPEEAKVHPARNQLTAFMGMKGIINADMKEIKVKNGDRILLCSDGLTGMVTEKEIAKIIELDEDVETAAKRLIKMANDVGGADNITVVLIEVIE